MKRTSFIAVLLFIALALAAFALPMLAQTYDRQILSVKTENYLTRQDYTGYTITPMEDMWSYIKEHELPPATPLAAQVYAKDDLFSHKGFVLYENLSHLNSYLAGDYMSFDIIIHRFPTANLRTIGFADGRRMYLVYMLPDGTRVYQFYNSEYSSSIRGATIIMKKVLSCDDFDSITIGDSIAKLSDIDPIANDYKESFDTLTSTVMYEHMKDDLGLQYLYSHYSLTSYHLLTDGIIVIDYDFQNSEYTISNIHFYEDFRVPNKFFIPGVTSPEMEYDIYKIYPQDYVTELITIDPPPAGFGESEKPEPKLWDEVAWSIDITSDGKTRTLTSSDAAKLPTVQIIESTWTTDKENGGVTTSFYEGAELTDVLKSVGVGDFSEIEVIGFDGEKRVYDRETLMKNKTIVAWIDNKKFAITDSETGVALATDGGSPDEFIRSVRELIVR